MPPTEYSPGPPPKEAIDFFKAKRIEPAFSYQDVWNEEHAHAFTVAKLMDRDLLAEVQSALLEHLEGGHAYKDFAKRIKPILQAGGWWGEKEVTDPVTGETFVSQLGSPHRLRTIYHTNMRVARSVGQWQRIERTKNLRPYLRYRLGPSERHRPEHVAWDGIILPV